VLVSIIPRQHDDEEVGKRNKSSKPPVGRNAVFSPHQAVYVFAPVTAPSAKKSAKISLFFLLISSWVLVYVKLNFCRIKSAENGATAAITLTMEEVENNSNTTNLSWHPDAWLYLAQT
jgi:hypothetical protein